MVKVSLKTVSDVITALSENIEEDNNLDMQNSAIQQERSKRATKVMEKYMPNAVLRAMCTKQAVNTYGKSKKAGFETLGMCELKHRILEYRDKVGKNKTKSKNTSVFLDISKGISKQQIAPDVEVQGNRNEVKIQFCLESKLCLPFETCFIYNEICAGTSAVVEITDNNDGTYSGKIYMLFIMNSIYQMSFTISHKEGKEWCYEISTINHQRALGQGLSNLAILLLLYQHRVLSGTENMTGLSDVYDNLDPIQKLFIENSSVLVFMLNSLSSYKSKELYKLTKGNETIYTYTDVGTDITEYIKRTYPDFAYEKQDGWLVNGYWETVKDMGKNRNGKPIKGLNWKDLKTDSAVEVNGQTAHVHAVHALQRAKERYNKVLDTTDLKEIQEACLSGKAKPLSIKNKFGKISSTIQKNKTGCYRINHKSTLYDVAIQCSIDSSYRVATFLPKPKDKNCMIIDSKDYNTILEDTRDA